MAARELEDVEECCESLPASPCVLVALLNSEQLWIPAHHQGSNTPAGMARDLMAAGEGKTFSFKGVAHVHSVNNPLPMFTHPSNPTLSGLFKVK